MSIHTIAMLMIAASGGGILAGAAGYRSGYRDGIARAHRDAMRWARHNDSHPSRWGSAG